MLISLKNNIAFLAMTKTGSTSIEATLAPFCDIVFTQDPRVKHMQLRRFERFLRPYLKSLDHDGVETTCLFRNPTDWLGSWYRYRQRDALLGNSNSTAQVSFEDFVLSYLDENPKPFARVGQQSEFIIDKQGNVGIDYLFRYDQFEKFERFMSDRMNQPLKFDHLNASAAKSLELTTGTRTRLEGKLSRDFEIFESITP